MKNRGLFLGILAVGTFGLSVLSTTLFETQAQSRDDVALARQFIGMWRLASWTQRLADGTTRQQPISVAYIVYTDTNRMCFVGMDPNRPETESRLATASQSFGALQTW